MANRRKPNPSAMWKIAIEVESNDGTERGVPEKTAISIEKFWQLDKAKDGPLSQIAFDLGAVLKMVEDSGRLVPGGDVRDGFSEGYGEGSQE